MTDTDPLPLTDVQREVLANLGALRRYTPKDRSEHAYRHDLDGSNVTDATVDNLFAHALIRVDGRDAHGETKFALTDKGRELLGKPKVKVRWTRLADGSFRAVGLPVLIPARDSRDVPLTVRAPNYRDASQPDGWFWSAVVWPADVEAMGYVDFWSIPAAKAWVADNLGYVLAQGDPDYDGDPAASADARAAATREWQERNARFRAEQQTVQDLYDRPLSDEEERLIVAVLGLAKTRRRRVMDEIAKDSR